MPAAEGIFTENAAAKGRRRKVLSAIFLGVIALHVAAGFVAGAIVVAKYFFPPPAAFEVKRDIRLPAKQREHRMNMAAFDAMAPKPTRPSARPEVSRPMRRVRGQAPSATSAEEW